ncbi:MAG: glycosyltransferase family 2 protein [Candidatus Buchananbacteria bacterium]|nr:glycosyltransferase family 2 protein [Candidatus Buchananbacteria bacterium]
MKKSTVKKITEIFPAALVWLTLLAVVILSFARPLWAIYFILVFVVYWIVRLFYMLVWLLISWFKYYRDIKIDWLEKIKKLDKNYLEYYHIIEYPACGEPYEVVERSLDELLKTHYPKDRMIVVLGGEERKGEQFQEVAKKITEKFGHQFFKLLVTVHKLQPDELQGKGANVHHMELEIKKLVDELALPYEKLIVSSFDIETLPHKQYFSYLAYKYLTHPNPTHASYQPLILYNNNIWQSSPIIRVVASATTFWLLTDLSRPEKLLTFSSHSMSFKMLVDVGFHDNTIVTEDSRICLQGLLKYDGKYEVVPMFITLSMDTVYIGKFWQSIKNQYKQMRRWAWGVEHFPWMWENFFGQNANKNISFKKRLQYLWNQTEGMYSWAVAPLLILIVGRLPLYLASDADKATAFFQNAPRMLENLMFVGMVGLILNSIMYTLMLPTKPKNYSWCNYLIMVAQWVVFPVTMIIFGSVPAIDAQTRLMLGGKYKLGFWVTEKKIEK